jgi:branched-chain amino acid transport system ATP-binding protein
MIRVEHVTVVFGGVRPLDGLDAELRAPICGLIGPNGAGKTTLLNVLSGFVRPAEGRVWLDELDLTRLSPVQRMRAGLRRTFQQEQVVDDLTAYENVMAIADHVPLDRACGRAEVESALALTGLGERAGCPGRRLNLFERRMVEIAKTLIGAPKLILMDEPGAGLNEAETERLRALLLRIPSASAAQLILIDHDADLIAALCEEALVLDFGKRMALGPTRTVLADPAVRQAYLGEPATAC